ncbi:unnamed protein product [Choristocarpus tenellus]
MSSNERYPQASKSRRRTRPSLQIDTSWDANGVSPLYSLDKQKSRVSPARPKKDKTIKQKRERMGPKLLDRLLKRNSAGAYSHSTKDGLVLSVSPPWSEERFGVKAHSSGKGFFREGESLNRVGHSTSRQVAYVTPMPRHKGSIR